MLGSCQRTLGPRPARVSDRREGLGVEIELSPHGEPIGLDRIAHDAVCIQDERVTVWDAEALVECPVSAARLTVGPEVGEDSKPKVVLFRPVAI